MKYLVQTLCLLMLSHEAFALGDTSPLPDNPERMNNTVGTLNQFSGKPDGVDEETDFERNFSPQDLQEEQYQQDLAREREEWEETKRIEKYRYDE